MTTGNSKKHPVQESGNPQTEINLKRFHCFIPDITTKDVVHGFQVAGTNVGQANVLYTFYAPLRAHAAFYGSLRPLVLQHPS
ncbi:hypothetical protein [Sporosarcina luteola]|uniref:hypothetical protein n=1 Tax=Sporosarcina luteola TaxID=582850 RepID=UPI0020404AD9|nr:hypothetical protein [Sporosarcina luteola]MCM3711723.1 hypothetical protein [Sporosarcina luteola]